MKTVFALSIVVSLTACEYYDAPNRPIPKDFLAKRPDGSLMRAVDFRGKPWVVSIWAPGCHICAGELPDIEALRQKYESQGIGFLSVSLEPTLEPNRRFMEQMNMGMSYVMAQGEVLAPFAVNQIPSTVFINSEGVIVKAARGPKRASSLEKQVRALLPP